VTGGAGFGSHLQLKHYRGTITVGNKPMICRLVEKKIRQRLSTSRISSHQGSILYFSQTVDTLVKTKIISSLSRHRWRQINQWNNHRWAINHQHIEGTKKQF